ncbi:mucin-15 [Betta splendens]|uniref:Mucin-15 n=1 Tax=Betta splendens TaxID=158456 RepID=A0A6P7LZI8_BETSP|nr:mucin-15 [Betta splendens]XP_055363552.1 mucin-15 [Betta splendens]
MERLLKTAVWLLLFVQLAAQTTDSPGRTLDKAWLREPPRKLGRVNGTTEEEDASSMDSEGTSGFTVADPEEELNVIAQNSNTTDQEVAEATAPPAPTASVPANTSLVNGTKDHTSTAPPPTSDPETKNSTGLPDSQPTAVAPQANATRAPAFTNSTEPNGTRAATPEPNGTRAATPEPNGTRAATPEANGTSTPFPPETTAAGPWTSTPTSVDTPAKANKTDKDAALGERGFASEPPRNKRYAQWAAVLGTMLAVSVLGLVAYAVLRSRRHKGFSHRKLVEEYPSDPVLRLDNSEPLDLNFGGSAYYNAGLQGDSIQMTNFPGRH